MKIIARTTGGFILEASEGEIKSILHSFGIEKPEPTIGVTIPATDFIAKVERLKAFGQSYDYGNLKEKFSFLQRAILEIDEQLKVIS